MNQQDTQQMLTVENQSNQQNRPQSAKLSTQQSKQMNNRPQSAKQDIKQTNQISTPKKINKEKSHPFFKDTRVGDCACVKVEDGVPKAVPFFQKPQKTFAEQMLKMGYKESLTQEQFKLQSPVFATSKIKPLCRYNPNAQRNILASPTYKMPKSNASQIQFGTEKINYKTSSSYGNFAQVGFVTNPLILASKTKDLKKQMQK